MCSWKHFSLSTKIISALYLPYYILFYLLCELTYRKSTFLIVVGCFLNQVDRTILGCSSPRPSYYYFLSETQNEKVSLCNLHIPPVASEFARRNLSFCLRKESPLHEMCDYRERFPIFQFSISPLPRITAWNALSITSATAFITRCIPQLGVSCVATSCMNGVVRYSKPWLTIRVGNISSRIRPSQWMCGKKDDNAVGVCFLFVVCATA